MVVKTRLEPVARDFRVMVDGATSQQAQKAAIANFARVEIAKADAVNARVLKRVPTKEITVDGRLGAPLESVRPNGGIIIAEWDIFTDVLIWIMTELQKRSPVRSGDYVRSHILLADGTEIDATDTPPHANEFIFLNPVPYAKKIEIGKTKAGRDFVIQVPNRIYEKVASDAKRRFGNSADIKFTYRETTGSYRLRRPSRNGRRKRVGRAVPSPAIIVKIKG